jgi:hypothetical protein
VFEREKAPGVVGEDHKVARRIDGLLRPPQKVSRRNV